MNKFNIGDIVGHKETPSLKFRIINVLEGVEQNKHPYAYAFHQIFDDDMHEMEGMFYGLGGSVYMEEDLFLIRRPTYDELNLMLKEALSEIEIYDDVINSLRSEMRSLKNKS